MGREKEIGGRVEEDGKASQGGKRETAKTNQIGKQLQGLQGLAKEVSHQAERRDDLEED